MPALFKLMLTFALILLLNRRFPLYISLFAGCFAIGTLMGQDVPSILSVIWLESSSGSTLGLAGVIVLILFLSGLLRMSGQLDRMVSSFQKVSPDPRFTFAAMPALIGLLPMPGGALFSAPMVESAVGQDTVRPELKVAINYWFRHIWEFWWPLYPGVILGISLFGVESWKLILAQSPLTVGSIIGGILFILACIPICEHPDHAMSGTALRAFAREAMPIIVTIVVFGTFQALMELIRWSAGFSFPSPKYAGLALGIVLAMLLVIRRNSLDRGRVVKSFLNPSLFSMVMIVLAIMSFKGVLGGSEAIEHVRADLTEYHIPPLLMVALLPFIAGVVTGIAIGFVGTSFPLVVALVPAGASAIPYAVLAYGFGYMGMMFSPIHLCLVISREYFGADMASVYRYLWRPTVFGLIWAALLFSLYRLVLG